MCGHFSLMSSIDTRCYPVSSPIVSAPRFSQSEGMKLSTTTDFIGWPLCFVRNCSFVRARVRASATVRSARTF